MEFRVRYQKQLLKPAGVPSAVIGGRPRTETDVAARAAAEENAVSFLLKPISPFLLSSRDSDPSEGNGDAIKRLGMHP